MVCYSIVEIFSSATVGVTKNQEIPEAAEFTFAALLKFYGHIPATRPVKQHIIPCDWKCK